MGVEVLNRVEDRPHQHEDAEGVAFAPGVHLPQLLLADFLQPLEVLFYLLQAEEVVEVKLGNMLLDVSVQSGVDVEVNVPLTDGDDVYGRLAESGFLQG